ncbi:MAG: DUF427 domain-containing protein [Acidimicrobiia bacterium]
MSTSMSERVKVERSQRRVRVMVAGRMVADSSHPLRVWEVPYYPTYYFPAGDVESDYLEATDQTRHSPRLGDATFYDVVVDGDHRSEAAYTYDDARVDALADHFAFKWQAMDHWFEEDEEVFVHPRDPYTRIDILHSTRHVTVEVGGVTVADTRGAAFLFETGLPVRYYIPKTDVRFDLLIPTDKKTSCPYKGDARYWSVTVGDEVYDDIVWSYDYPVPESQKIAGMVAFYNEKVDIHVDGELQERPRTKFA